VSNKVVCRGLLEMLMGGILDVALHLLETEDENGEQRD